MKPEKIKQPVQAADKSNVNQLPLVELLKQSTLDSYDLQQIFKVSANTILNWCNNGTLSFSRVGRKKYFDAYKIKELLEQRRQVMVPGEKKKKTNYPAKK